MEGDIHAFGFLLLIHTNRRDESGYLQCNPGTNQRERDADKCADELIQDLAGVTIHQAQRRGLTIGQLERVVHRSGGEDSGQQAANEAANAVDAKSIQGIVITQLVLHQHHHVEADKTGDEADNRARNRSHKASALGDGGQAGDGAGDGPQRARLAALDSLGHHPRHSSGGGCEVRGDKCTGGQRRGAQRASGVETKPADPEHAGSDKAENQTVRHHPFLRVAAAFPDHDGRQEGRKAGRDVDDRASREVEYRNPATEERIQVATFAPNHVRDRDIHKEKPEHREHHHGMKSDALRKGPGDKRGRDDGEHHLVGHEGEVRDSGGVVGIGRGPHAVEEGVAEVADEGIAFAENQAVTADSPEEGDDSHHDEALHHGAEDVLAAHQTGVEQGQAGAGHHQDKGAAYQHPGVVTRGLSGLYRGLQGYEFRIFRCQNRQRTEK